MKGFKINVRFSERSENLSRYFTDISNERILDPQVEAELAVKAKNGDAKAREKIIVSNLRFAVSVAKAYAGKNISLEDLISEGNKGLVEAIETFDPSTGFKFISYAVWHIRKNIFYYINSNSKVFRIPESVASEIRRYQLLEDDFICQNGREPSLEELLSLIEDSGIEQIRKVAVDIIRNKPTGISLESPFRDDDDFSNAPINWISNEDPQEEALRVNDIKFAISNILSGLLPDEKKIVEMKYGLCGKEPSTFTEIGSNFRKSSEWARNNLYKIEKKMKNIAKRRGIKNWI